MIHKHQSARSNIAMVSPSYSSSSSTTNPFSCPREQNNNFKPPAPRFQSSLHSVRKLPTKIMKSPIAPMPPTPPRIYKVDSSNFKQLVQKLTAAPEFQPRRLESVAPPPLSVSANKMVDTDKQSTTALELLPSPAIATTAPVSSTTYRELMTEKVEMIQPWKQAADGFASTASPMGFCVSPSSTSHLWWSFPLLSPGTISSMEQGLVL